MSRPGAQRAHRLVCTAIEHGHIVPEPCSVCGESRADAHHEDYAKPLDIVWLCRACHIMHHKKQAKPWKPVIAERIRQRQAGTL